MDQMIKLCLIDEHSRFLILKCFLYSGEKQQSWKSGENVKIRRESKSLMKGVQIERAAFSRESIAYLTGLITANNSARVRRLIRIEPCFRTKLNSLVCSQSNREKEATSIWSPFIIPCPVITVQHRKRHILN